VEFYAAMLTVARSRSDDEAACEALKTWLARKVSRGYQVRV
jgi:hypothetical protein